jgi:hypothetical protein
MRLTLVLLTLILTLANAASVAQVSVDVASESHHADVHEAHAQPEDVPQHDHGPLAHHCCHTHAHFFLLSVLDAAAAVDWNHAWISHGTPSANLIGYAPPTPPPKA